MIDERSDCWLLGQYTALLYDSEEDRYMQASLRPPEESIGENLQRILVARSR